MFWKRLTGQDPLRLCCALNGFDPISFGWRSLAERRAGEEEQCSERQLHLEVANQTVDSSIGKSFHFVSMSSQVAGKFANENAIFVLIPSSKGADIRAGSFTQRS